MKKYSILLIFLVLIEIVGCEGFLDKQPLTSLSDATFWKTENDVLLALTGCYQIGGMTGSGAKQRFDLWNQDTHLRLFEATTDNGFEKDNNVTDINNGNLVSSYGPIRALWATTYEKIIRCNNFLEHIDNVNMDIMKKNEMIAEVKTIRAFNYFYLAFLWGDVPLVTKVLSVNEANNVFQDSKDKIVDFVVAELRAAALDLPVTRPNEEYGRITQGAALAILGRVFLAEKKWSDAKEVYKQIIDLGIYEIDPRFSDLFIEKGENSKEFIMVSKRMPDVYSNSILLSCLGFSWGGWHHYSPYNELVEDFECIDGLPIKESPLFDPENPYNNRDPRLLKTIFIDNISVFKDKLYIAHPDSNPVIYQDQVLRRPWSGYMVRKFCDEDYNGNLKMYGCDFPMIRYAEVLLGYLEANIEEGSSITQNLLDETINKVRGRSEINMPKVTELNQDKLRIILRRERRVEFAWEGLRLFDLFRWHTAHILLNGRFHGMKVCSKEEAPNYKNAVVNSDGYYFCKETFFRENVDYLWPIPQSEIDINKNLIQNKGY